MGKLYPPHIEGTTPAFEGTTLVVPFSMNEAVSFAEIKSIAIKVKKINTNEVILTKETDTFTQTQATFELTELEQFKFRIGQYYRIQLAYINTDGVMGYYSVISVIKYTSKPEISVEKNNNVYTLTYTQTKDSTEKLYSSNYSIILNDNVVYSSDEILHNVVNDDMPNEAIEVYVLEYAFIPEERYQVIFNITTSNGLQTSSNIIEISNPAEIGIKYDAYEDMKLVANNNLDGGYTELSLKDSDDEYKEISGFFMIFRSEVKEYYDWELLWNIALNGERLSEKGVIDYTTEQGKEYIYAIQQYDDNGNKSAKWLSNKIKIDFEDLYLIDAKRQLKIKFNPKVSSMKDVLSESKSNTIGSKYPFFTRNGHINYKEFNISGLISYLMDDNEMFNSTSVDYKTTNLTGDNIGAELNFKLDVMKWLSNGEIKLMKSPTEGNYLVRLTNISLSPSDQLGRMLHTFSGTASECMDYDLKNLRKIGFFKYSTPKNYVREKKKTVYLKSQVSPEMLSHSATTVYLTGMEEGAIAREDGNDIYLGVSGSYKGYYQQPISSFTVVNHTNYPNGVLTYTYKEDINNLINSYSVEQVPIQQFYSNRTIWRKDNILKRANVMTISIAKFKSRLSDDLYFFAENSIPALNNVYCYKDNFENTFFLSSLNSEGIHRIFSKNTLLYTGYYYDAKENKIYYENKSDFNIIINNEEFPLKKNILTYYDLDASNIRIAPGVYVELTYYRQVIQ